MSNLENSFKNALTDFDQVSPSKGLWARISTSLLLKSGAVKTLLISISLLLIISIPSYFIISKNQNNPNYTSTNQNIEASNKSTSNTIKTNNAPIIKQKENKETINNELGITKETSKDETSIKAQNKPQASFQKTTDNSIIKEEVVTANTKPNSKPEIELSRSPQQTNPQIMPLTNAMVSSATLTNDEANKQHTASVQKTNLNTPLSAFTYETENEKQIVKVNTLNYDYNLLQINTEVNTPNIYQKPRSVFGTKLELFAGPNIAYNYMSINKEGAEDYKSFRASNESPKLSYHVGINYLSYHNSWFISVGLNYHKIEDRLTYSLPSIRIDSSISSYLIFQNTYKQIVTGYIQNPNDSNSVIPIVEMQVTQDTSVVNDVFYDSTKTMAHHSLTNSYSYIEIPLLVGKSFRYKHFVFDIEGGVSWSRLIKSEVHLPNEKLTGFLSPEEIETVIVKNTFNGMLGLGMGYQVNENNVLFIRPELRYNLNSMFDKNSPISQHYLQLRLSIGMRIEL